MNEWIKTTERLPDESIESDWVIGVATGRSGNCRWKNAIVMVEFKPETGEWFLSEGPAVTVAVAVSHWMPLPELPEEIKDVTAR